MLHAAESGDEEAVVQLLAQGSDATAVDPSNKQTALHLAAKSGHFGIATLLLAHCPALIEAVDESFDTALHLAARNGHDAIVQLLLFHGARVNVSTSSTSRRTALHCAVEGGHVSVVRQLLAHTPMLLDVGNYDYHPPLSALQLAAWGSHTEVVALLLAQGADTAADWGRTALHFAVEKGNANIVAQLLAHNPGLAEVKDRIGRTALYAATQEQIVAQLLAHTSEMHNLEQNKKTPLHTAAERGHDGIVAQLLAHSPSLIDMVDHRNRTALHDAAEGGHIKLVAQLLTRKPDLINKQDEDSYTALMHAIKGRHDDLVAFLLAHEPSVIDTGHPLHVVAAFGSYVSVERLLSLKPSLCDTIDLLGRTPLHCAAANGTEESVMARLLDLSPHLIDSTDKTREQLTPLHLAVQRIDDQNVNVVTMLLARNPKSIDAKTSRGMTALHLAADVGNKQIVAQLLAHCPTLIDEVSSMGNAAHVASFAGHISIVELLLDLKPELSKVTHDNKTVLHLLCRFNWSTRKDGHVFIEKVWRLNPAALHVIDGDGDTPYHFSFGAGDEWCVKFFQSKLSCEEILHYSTNPPYHRIQPPLKRFCEPAVSACLVDDAASLVYGYLGVEHVLCMKQRKRFRE